MKKLCLSVFFMAWAITTPYAQEKQRKVLLEQIAGLKVYINYAQEGYSIAKKGLGIAADLKKGELRLHTDYLSSLKSIKPEIKKYSRLVEIIVLQWKIVENHKRVLGQLEQADLFHGSELAYIKRVFERLLDGCSKTMEELIAVTTDGLFVMKDDERIKRIDALYFTMKENYMFSQSFNKQTKILCLSRVKDNKDVQTSRGLHGLIKE